MAFPIWASEPALSSTVAFDGCGGPDFCRDENVIVKALYGLHIAIIRNGSIIYTKIESHKIAINPLFFIKWGCSLKQKPPRLNNTEAKFRGHITGNFHHPRQGLKR